MAHVSTHGMLPPSLLKAIGAMVLVSIVAAGLGRHAGIGTLTAPAPEAVRTASVRFEDRADGGIGVFAMPGNRPIKVLPAGTNGFLRGVMRGFARERRLSNLGPEAPFTLSLDSQRRVSLTDSATGRRAELTAFGQANAEVFVRLVLTANAAKGETTQ